MSKEKHSDILKMKEAAELLGIGKSTLYRLCAENKIPHIKIGGSIRLRRSTLEKWLSDQEAQALNNLNKDEPR